MKNQIKFLKKNSEMNEEDELNKNNNNEKTEEIDNNNNIKEQSSINNEEEEEKEKDSNNEIEKDKLSIINEINSIEKNNNNSEKNINNNSLESSIKNNSFSIDKNFEDSENIINTNSKNNININKNKIKNNSSNKKNNSNRTNESIKNEIKNKTILDKIKVNSSLEISYKEYLGDYNYYSEIDSYSLRQKKKDGIYMNSYFDSSILNENNIYNKINSNNLINYFNKIETNYNLNKDNFNLIFDFIDIDSKNKKFINIINNNNNNKIFLISNKITPISIFNKIYKKNSDKFLFFRQVKNIKFDSFYRSFIFSLLENLIITKNNNLFNSIFLDVFTLNNIYKNFSLIFSLNFNEFLEIFSMFFDLMKTFQYEIAQKLLINLYQNVNSNFDIIFIIYLRYVVFLYNENLNKHINNKDNENKDVNLKNIIMFHNEPNKIVFDTLSIIFNIDLNIFYIDGDMKDFNIVQFNNNKNNKNKIKNNINRNKIEINLGFFYDGYHVIYNDENYIQKIKNYNNLICEDYKELLNVIPFNNNIEIDYEENSENENLYYCKKCQKNTKFLQQISNSKNIICSECLSLLLLETFQIRSTQLAKEHYKNYLYYLRPVCFYTSLSSSISSSNNPEILYFSNSDCLFSFNSNFSEFFLNSLTNICNGCYNNFNSLIILSCNCKYCKDCLLKMLNKSTENRVYQNVFEKKNTKKKNCKCLKEFFPQEAITKLKENNFINSKEFNDFKDKSIQRLKIYCNGYCMNCLKSFINDKGEILDINVNSNSKKIIYYKFDTFIDKEIKNNEENKNKEINIDYFEGQHILCENCYKKINSKINKKDNNYIKDLNGKCICINCKVCEMEHLIKNDEWKKFQRTRCACIIF